MKTKRVRQTWWCAVHRCGAPLLSFIQFTRRDVIDRLDSVSPGWRQVGTRVAKLRITEITRRKARKARK